MSPRVLNAHGRDAASGESLALSMARDRFHSSARVLSRTWDWLYTSEYQTSFSGTVASATPEAGFGNAVAMPLVTGSDTTGRSGVGSVSFTLTGPQGFCALLVEGTFELSALSDGTNTYTARIGFMDSLTGDPVDGGYLRYTHGTNSGKWQAVARTNSSETDEDSTVLALAASQPHHFGFLLFPGSDLAYVFLQNNAGGQGFSPPFVCKVAGIPQSSGRTYGIGASIIKSAGTSSRTMWVYDLTQTFVSDWY